MRNTDKLTIELRTALPCEVCRERPARVREEGRVCLVCVPVESDEE